MTIYGPTFNVEQFELTGDSGGVLTPEQEVVAASVRDRVNSQLDWVAQLLGWSGPNYWTFLAQTPNEKRQVLGGSYGVFSKYVIPRVRALQNWDDKIVIYRDDRIKIGQPLSVGNLNYTIESVEDQGEFFSLSVGPLDQNFFDTFAQEGEIKIVATDSWPAPFDRPAVLASANRSFTVKAGVNGVELYPIFDKLGMLPYRYNLLFAGATYSFDQNVYVSFSGPDALKVDIAPVYNEAAGLWELSFKGRVGPGGLPPTAYLVWPYSRDYPGKNLYLEVSLTDWINPSDWKTNGVIKNFTGAWGNKGGFLPFNLCFDSLGLHGFSERNSLYVPTTKTSLSADTLLNSIYYQSASLSLSEPYTTETQNLWWNPQNATLSVHEFNADTECVANVEIRYRDFPTTLDGVRLDETYFNLAEFFTKGGDSLPPGRIIKIRVIDGISNNDPRLSIIGLQGTLVGFGTLIMHREESGMWSIDRIELQTEDEFNRNALALPFRLPIIIKDSKSIQNSPGKNYYINNLTFNIIADTEIHLVKYYNNTTWEITPESVLRFVGNTSIQAKVDGQPDPQQGDMWWDYAVPDTQLRNAAVYYGDAWVGVNKNEQQSAPPAPVDYYKTLVFYCNGYQLAPGVPYMNGSFSFKYTPNELTGQYEFEYTLYNRQEGFVTPTVVVSDSLTSEFRKDISKDVFSGIQYFCSPNVYDAVTPLRIWKSQNLQVTNSLDELGQKTYLNPLVADENSGPADENWSRYFLRLPPGYERNGPEWQKVNLICQNFGYAGSSVTAEVMEVPPGLDQPQIYEELCLFKNNAVDVRFIYAEDYLYSSLGATDFTIVTDYENSGILPSIDLPYDDFDDSNIVEYDALHSRTIVRKEDGGGFGDWKGVYVSATPCRKLTGHLIRDLAEGRAVPMRPPIWDASIYKVPPQEGAISNRYSADSNNYKIGYAYFMADLSAAEDGFFDLGSPSSWKEPINSEKTLYLTPASVGG